MAKTVLDHYTAKRNPFATERTDSIAFSFGNTPFANIDHFYQFARQRNFRGSIRGKHGRGKTTLLCELNTHLSRLGIQNKLVFLPREQELHEDAIQSINRSGGQGCIILLDGIERIGLLDRHQLISRSRKFGGLIATTHFPGRLRTLLHCRTTQNMVESMVISLGQDDPQTKSMARHLFEHHRGNMRSVLRDLYDRFAEGQFTG